MREIFFIRSRCQDGSGENAKGLSDRLAQRTAQILPDFLKGIETDGLLSGLPQKDEEATYTPMITRRWD